MKYKKKQYDAGDVVHFVPDIKTGCRYDWVFVSQYMASVYKLDTDWVIVRRYRTPQGKQPRYIIRALHIDTIARSLRTACASVSVSEDMIYSDIQEKLE